MKSKKKKEKINLKLNEWITINITTFLFGLDCGSMQLNSWDVGQEVSPRTEKCKAKKKSTRVTDLLDGHGW